MYYQATPKKQNEPILLLNLICVICEICGFILQNKPKLNSYIKTN